MHLFFKLKINNSIAKMEVGCLKHPGASTIGSQLLDEDFSHGWQILATQPWAPRSKGNRHPSHCKGKGWEENCLGDELPRLLYYGTQENASCTYATLLLLR